VKKIVYEINSKLARSVHNLESKSLYCLSKSFLGTFAPNNYKWFYPII